MSVSPCKYPRCQDIEGNPELTDTQFCAACQRRFERLLNQAMQDYIDLKTYLPRPAVTTTSGRGTVKAGYGHPREWASSLAQDIVKISVAYTTAFIKEKGTTLSQKWGPSYHPGQSELLQAVATKDYWTKHYEELAEWDQAPDMAGELAVLTRQAKQGLGQGRKVTHLIPPCPKCLLRALFTWEGSDTIECGNCYHRMGEQGYADALNESLAAQQRYNFHRVDDLIAEYDATAETPEPETGQSPAPQMSGPELPQHT
ncbi:hypothetical protein [Glutamicibacter ardleyensis]|uniref:Uncharacterized protein n=1 Tax=Glutamicibacter ardleyensis TaxID=225894 RepID=A0ABQ2DGX0_9MICC|nr:hypothetical protein [Glutamicibacter ardleyensis]GGJ55813.1 hypothetical protein GCM10007173_13310 [Glutamicibacter ardleyensis]